jgi:hypothetical protein
MKGIVKKDQIRKDITEVRNLLHKALGEEDTNTHKAQGAALDRATRLIDRIHQDKRWKSVYIASTASRAVSR